MIPLKERVLLVFKMSDATVEIKVNENNLINRKKLATRCTGIFFKTNELNEFY